MKEIALIAAVDKKWGIGRENELLFHLKTDMKFFKETTRGNIVIMGRKTMESLPGGKPLADRTNIVLTHEDSTNFLEKNPAEAAWTVCHSVNEVLVYVQTVPGEIYIIGGGSVYREFEPYASVALVTKIEEEREADTFFPDLDAMDGWKLASAGERFCENGVCGQFLRYEKRA
ncbi:MAG: dihydrofolate reductase [Roseburia sp.]|nr:dihydrofolate reductase [Roseburia sp.]